MLDRRGNDNTVAVSKIRVYTGAHDCLQVPIIAYRSLLDHSFRNCSSRPFVQGSQVKITAPVNRYVERIIPDGDISDVTEHSN